VHAVQQQQQQQQQRAPESIGYSISAFQLQAGAAAPTQF
jgi:hypothetical protein